jgi:hypothetical protein
MTTSFRRANLIWNITTPLREQLEQRSDLTMTWNKLRDIPHDRPVMIARWCDASPYNRDGIKEGHWIYDGVFMWRAQRDGIDRDLVCVSLDNERWLRGGTTGSGKDSLDWYRWADIPALPSDPAF